MPVSPHPCIPPNTHAFLPTHPPAGPQARQLAALAPQLPTEDPRLKSSTYDMVLSALLLNPAGAWYAKAWGCGWQAQQPALCLRRCTEVLKRRACDAALPPPSSAVPAEHGVLLQCVRRWPQGAYNVAQLQAAALQ